MIALHCIAKLLYATNLKKKTVVAFDAFAYSTIPLYPSYAFIVSSAGLYPIIKSKLFIKFYCMIFLTKETVHYSYVACLAYLLASFIFS